MKDRRDDLQQSIEKVFDSLYEMMSETRKLFEMFYEIEDNQNEQDNKVKEYDEDSTIRENCWYTPFTEAEKAIFSCRCEKEDVLEKWSKSDTTDINKFLRDNSPESQ